MDTEQVHRRLSLQERVEPPRDPRRLHSSGATKAELITMQGPWRTVEDVELATLMRVHWWNTSRLHSAIAGNPPTDY